MKNTKKINDELFDKKLQESIGAFDSVKPDDGLAGKTAASIIEKGVPEIAQSPSKRTVWRKVAACAAAFVVIAGGAATLYFSGMANTILDNGSKSEEYGSAETNNPSGMDGASSPVVKPGEPDVIPPAVTPDSPTPSTPADESDVTDGEVSPLIPSGDDSATAPSVTPSMPALPSDAGGRSESKGESDFSSKDGDLVLMEPSPSVPDPSVSVHPDISVAPLPPDAIVDPVPPDIIVDPEPPVIEPHAGLLTAGEWCDNSNWSFFINLLGQNQDFRAYQDDYLFYPTRRVKVTVTSDGKPLADEPVIGFAADGSELYKARTDNNGVAYLFAGLFVKDSSAAITSVTVAGTSYDVQGDDLSITLEGKLSPSKALDLMIMCDTTGSMGDELSYLQVEIKDIIATVQKDNANLPVRLSVNFYRDEGDEYVVLPTAFTSDINEANEFLAKQRPDGGGDYEEAVEQALDNAVNGHEWADGATKLLILVLDAPPHVNSTVSESLHASILAAAEKGIRVIPVASSGVNTNTECLLRTFAITTGGTYTFLTNDSGIGGSHLEPTIGKYEVEPLNSCLIRVINSYLD